MLRTKSYRPTKNNKNKDMDVKNKNFALYTWKTWKNFIS